MAKSTELYSLSGRCRLWKALLTSRPGWGPKTLHLMRPVLRRFYERYLNGGLVLAPIMEDLPYLDNRVLPSDRPGLDGRQRVRIRYRLHPNEVERRAESSYGS